MFSYQLIIVAVALLIIAIINVLNVEYSCNSFSAYSTIVAKNPNCSYNPDINANMPTLLERYFGYYENHTVTTSDGYILHMFRIPRKNPKGVVILAHSLFTDSIVFVSQRNESLAVMLWLQGYEVWLPNSRGTFYSMKHTTLNSRDYEFWDYSFHEMGTIDLKHFIDYIIGYTNGLDLCHVGFSLGSTSSAIYALTYPEEAKKHIKVFIEMAPTLILDASRTPLIAVIPIKDWILKVARFFQIGSFMHSDSVEGYLIHSFLYLPVAEYLNDFTEFLFGMTSDLDPKLLPLFVSLYPRGTSLKTVDHYMQITQRPGEFPQYDYGTEENMVRYGTPKAPAYNISKIKVPYYLISSTDDYVAPNEAADQDYEALSREAKVYGRLVVTGINHLDYMYGKSRVEKVYQPIITLLDEITSKHNN